MGVSTIPASGGGGLEPKYQKFTSSGTFTLPDGYGAANPLVVTIQVIGGGGGGSTARVTPSQFVKNTAYTGDFNSYFGNGNNLTINTVTGPSSTAELNFLNNFNSGGTGGSGGIAQTTLSLTSNLTVTVGAAGARPTGLAATADYIHRAGYNDLSSDSLGNGVSAGRNLTNNSGFTQWSNQSTLNDIRLIHLAATPSGGTGGTSTAGSISSAGGVGASGGIIATRSATSQTMNFQRYGNQNAAWNFGTNYDTPTYNTNPTHGAGGSPAGTTGAATPLLGTIAGGSSSATPVFGSFGVGGIKTDGATSTGVEGTGGGYDSIGASGAVIITWWGQEITMSKETFALINDQDQVVNHIVVDKDASDFFHSGGPLLPRQHDWVVALYALHLTAA